MATTFEKTRIHVNGDVFAAVAVFVAKASYYNNRGRLYPDFGVY